MLTPAQEEWIAAFHASALRFSRDKKGRWRDALDSSPLERLGTMAMESVETMEILDALEGAPWAHKDIRQALHEGVAKREEYR